MKRLGIAMICTAAMLVLLHSITPHTHSNPYGNNEATVSQNQPEAGVLGFLQLMFHPDLGTDHLDNFQNEAGDLHILPPLAPIASVPELTPISEDSESPKVLYLNSYKEEVYLLLSPLRGPPSKA